MMKINVYSNIGFATSMPALEESMISSNTCESVFDGFHDSSILNPILSIVTGRQLPTVDLRLSGDL